MTPAEPLIVAALITLTALAHRRRTRRPRDLGHVPPATVDRLQRQEKRQ